MQFSTALIALVAADLGLAAPAPNHLHKRGSFMVNRVPGAPLNRNALVSMKKVFNKYGMDMPAGLKASSEDIWAAPNSNAAASASATPSATGSAAQSTGSGGAGSQVGNVTNAPTKGDVEFVSPITVGGQTMMMDFDTGSSDLWLFSTSLPQQDQQGHQVFDPNKSPTFKQEPGASFAVKFGDGSAAQGNVVGTDNVQIGGATSTGQTVELASAVAQSFVQDTQSNGLVGLAFSKLNQVKPKRATTFLDSVQHQLAQPILAANLRHGAPGSYQFGEIDPTAFKGDLQFAAVNNSQGFWQFTSSQFAVGNGTVQQNKVNSPAIADTGTTLMMVDDAVATAYWGAVPGARVDRATGMFVFPCNTALPDFHVQLAPGNLSTISGSLLNFQRLQQAGSTGGGARRRFVGARHDHRDITIEIGFGGGPGQSQGAGQVHGQAQGPTCVGALQGNHGSGLQIYGDIMFKAQYTVFNIGNNTLGFAPHQ